MSDGRAASHKDPQTVPIKHVTHWVNGKIFDGRAERQGDIYDPSTGRLTGKVGHGGVNLGFPTSG